jgi:riboflavin synthase
VEEEVELLGRLIGVIQIQLDLVGQVVEEMVKEEHHKEQEELEEMMLLQIQEVVEVEVEDLMPKLVTVVEMVDQE